MAQTPKATPPAGKSNAAPVEDDEDGPKIKGNPTVAKLIAAGVELTAAQEVHVALNAMTYGMWSGVLELAEKQRKAQEPNNRGASEIIVRALGEYLPKQGIKLVAGSIPPLATKEEREKKEKKASQPRAPRPAPIPVR